MILRNAQINLQATVSDVTVPRDGVATVRFRDLALGPYATQKDNQLTVSMADHIDLNMPRDRALRILPGMQIEITGHPVFQPSTGNIFRDNLPSASLLTISIRNVYPPLGTLSIPNATIHLKRAQAIQPQYRPYSTQPVPNGNAVSAQQTGGSTPTTLATTRPTPHDYALDAKLNDEKASVVVRGIVTISGRRGALIAGGRTVFSNDVFTTKYNDQVNT